MRQPSASAGHRFAIERVAETRLPTQHADFQLICYRDRQGIAQVALTLGLDRESAESDPPPVRVHSECFTGDCLGSYRCDCGEQLQLGLAMVADAGRGAVIYVRGHEGRGIGLVEKLRAYALQDVGLDTVDANLRLGHPDDARRYEQTADILNDLGLRSIILLSSNPAKQKALTELGINVVARVPLPVADRPDNVRYLQTKRARMNHDQPVDLWAQLLSGEPPSRPQDALVSLYGPLAGHQPLVIAQLGVSLDGFIASRTGDARFVTGPEDRMRLHRMRALVDAVVIGASTVITDDPQLTVRDCSGPSPTRVLIDPRGRIPLSARVLSDAGAPTLWLRGPAANGVDERAVAAHVSVLRLPSDGPADPAALVRLLAERGLSRLLVEGGGRLVSAFVAADLVDRLYLTTAPVLIGDGVPGLRFEGTDLLRDALRADVRHFPLGKDICHELLLRQPGSTS